MAPDAVDGPLDGGSGDDIGFAHGRKPRELAAFFNASGLGSLGQRQLRRENATFPGSADALVGF